jgi:hypothetical protein
MGDAPLDSAVAGLHRALSSLLTGTVLVAAVALFAPSSALAFEEVGNRCAANDAVQDATLFGDASNNYPPPHPQIPQGEGWVITGWKVQVGPGLGPFEQQLAVFHFEGSQSYRKVAESAVETVVSGMNEFQTRISVTEFDHVGLYGPEKTLVCRNDPLTLAGIVEGPFPLNSTRRYEALGQTGVPVVAIVEPDRDGDGYGDETQDGCPQSAAYQGPCPTIALDAFPIVLKRSVLVLVSASSDSSVQVFGQVGWKPRHRGGATASKTPKPSDHISTGVIVGLAGSTQTLKPGEIGRFNVPLPKSVKRQLRQIPRGKSLKGTITARTTDLTGKVVDRTLTIRLPGQKRS